MVFIKLDFEIIFQITIVIIKKKNRIQVFNPFIKTQFFNFVP